MSEQEKKILENEDLSSEETAEAAADNGTAEEGSAEAVQDGETADGSAEADETTEEGGEAAEGKKSKLFGKKNKKPDPRDEKIKELEDRDLRRMAEFENFRKRSEKEKAQMFDMGAKSIVEKLLPVVDNFERGLATLTDEQKEEPFAQGVEKVYQQLNKTLEEMGVTAIEAVGKEFDPNLHNAVMQTESDEYESGIVAQELQKGYMYRDIVVRHSMVAVVQ